MDAEIHKLRQERLSAQTNYHSAMAQGKSPEMECAIKMSQIVASHYQKGDRILDVGCGGGHYLRSLKKRLLSDINYIGLDYHLPHLQTARRNFPETHWIQGNILQLAIPDQAFDIVICDNTLTSLPPPPYQAIRELIRVTKKYLILRTETAPTNYLIRVLPETIPDSVNPDEFMTHPLLGTHRNLYSPAFLCNELQKNAPDARIHIIEDSIETEINQDNSNPLATRNFHGKRISGALVVNFTFFVVETHYAFS